MLSGLGGNDQLWGHGGNDTLIGGPGSGDTAVQLGAWVNYTITGVGTLTITDTRGGSPDGTDTVSGVEMFKFSNGTFTAAEIVDAAPTDIALSATTVAEALPSTAVVGGLSCIDANSAAGDTATFSLVNSAGGRFAISGTNLVVADGSLLDFEASASHQVTVRVTDAKGLFFDEVFTIDLADVNEVPGPVSLANATAALAESTSTAAHIKVADIVVTDDAQGSETLALTGADAGLFEIAGTELFLKGGVALDFETKSSYSVAVTADDGTVGGPLDAISPTYTLAISNVSPETILGTGAANILAGGSDKDRLFGLGGNDKLFGKGGVDTLTGGFGRDVDDGRGRSATCSTSISWARRARPSSPAT